jgi:hypothetical protein
MSFGKTENFLETPLELVDWTSNEEVIENYEPVTFSLDENYLEKVAGQCGDASETGMSDSSEDLTGSEMDTGDSDIVIEQKNAKGLTRCVIVDKLDGYIKRCEKAMATLWSMASRRRWYF